MRKILFVVLLMLVSICALAAQEVEMTSTVAPTATIKITNKCSEAAVQLFATGGDKCIEKKSNYAVVPGQRFRTKKYSVSSSCHYSIKTTATNSASKKFTIKAYTTKSFTFEGYANENCRLTP